MLKRTLEKRLKESAKQYPLVTLPELLFTPNPFPYKNRKSRAIANVAFVNRDQVLGGGLQLGNCRYPKISQL
jgi:hypothetical protein